jgi:alkanesulfonate monooxygenase SsuD/methylene tetrahydromethanopterin reductase-like flavin-dependent oxidoreductase (luciferase family)
VLTLTWVAAVTERVPLGTSVLVLPMRHPIPLAKELATQDPVTFRTKHIPAEITDMTMTPLPVAPIPLWIGGSSDAALRRTIRLADGWHGSRETPEQTAAIARRLRAERPGADFTISTRVNWDGRDLGALRERIAAYEASGVQHIMMASDLLRSAALDNWDAIIEGVGRLVAEWI